MPSICLSGCVALTHRLCLVNWLGLITEACVGIVVACFGVTVRRVTQCTVTSCCVCRTITCASPSRMIPSASASAGAGACRCALQQCRSMTTCRPKWLCRHAAWRAGSWLELRHTEGPTSLSFTCPTWPCRLPVTRVAHPCALPK